MILPAIFCLLLCSSSACSALEGMEFVDAEGSTGYYVDLNSVWWGEENQLGADIAVIKAATNRLYRYTMQFDLGMNTYQIMYSEVYVYDTRQLLEYSYESPTQHVFGPNSMMQQIVEYIVYEERR